MNIHSRHEGIHLMKIIKPISNSYELNKIVKIYEIRERKARLIYQKQREELTKVQDEFEARYRELLLVEAEDVQLKACENSTQFLSNVQAQQLIRNKRTWLLYDFEKTQYFLDEAEHDLNTTKSELNKKRNHWLKLQRKRIEFESKIKG